MTDDEWERRLGVELTLIMWVANQPDPWDWCIISACECGCGEMEIMGPAYSELPEEDDTVH